MRLGLMVYGSITQLSGGYLYDRQLRKAWQRAGHQVEVISLPQSNFAGNLVHNWDRYWRDRLLGLQVDCLIQDELCHPSLFILNTSIRSNIHYPLISLVHHLRLSETLPAAQRWISSKVERQYLQTVDGFIFNSKPTQTSVERALNQPISGVVATPGRDHLDIAIQSHQPGRRSNSAEFQILFVGNLIERKGLHWLLEALSGLDRGGWHLHVIGRTDLETDYARQIQKTMAGVSFRGRVTYHGPVEPEALSQHYDRADLLAVPSSHEGFGLVYLEAMGHGLPVLASASGGASDLVRHGQNGYLIAPGNVVQLRRYLQQYLDDGTLLNKHGKAAMDRFSQQPTWVETSQVIIDYLQRNFIG